jgi:hypothetical protein
MRGAGARIRRGIAATPLFPNAVAHALPGVAPQGEWLAARMEPGRHTNLGARAYRAILGVQFGGREGKRFAIERAGARKRGAPPWIEPGAPASHSARAPVL